MGKCKTKLVTMHTYRIATPAEIKERKIKSKGIGIWICTNCGKITHSM
jgi:ribosomal protein L37AE/L43A